MTVIGGPYAFLGPAAGAFVFEFVRELIAQFPVLEERWQLVFGVILLGVVLYFENGVAGGLERLRSRVAGGEAEAAEEAPTAEAGPESEAERPDD
jgi:ABC-type branched-subunit amino acid transport system permease subunit